MAYRLGDRVSLRPNVPETRFDNLCGALPRSTGPSYRATVIPGSPGNCWHETCRILRIFPHDGGFLIENKEGFVRQGDPETLMKCYD